MSKTGRNDDCPCGSERKYKKCCLSRDVIIPNITNKTEIRKDFNKNANKRIILTHEIILHCT